MELPVAINVKGDVIISEFESKSSDKRVAIGHSFQNLQQLHLRHQNNLLVLFRKYL